jgi:hypothetical protein
MVAAFTSGKDTAKITTAGNTDMAARKMRFIETPREKKVISIPAKADTKKREPPLPLICSSNSIL